MNLLCLCSAHGSPGVTTTVLALAGVWPDDGRCLVVEGDPFGGMIASRFGLHDTPGLSSLAGTGRKGVDTDLVWRHAQQLPGGVPVLVAPASADQAHAVLRDLAEPLSTWAVTQSEMDVIVDCGRLTPGPVALPLLQRADRVLLLTRPSVDQLRPAARRIDALATVGVEAELLLVGEEPYGPQEVASSLEVSVAGMVAWDPVTAGSLTGASVGGDLRRSALVRSAASLVDILTGDKSTPLETNRDLPATVEEGVGS